MTNNGNSLEGKTKLTKKLLNSLLPYFQESSVDIIQ